jgi:hypothetical protein
MKRIIMMIGVLALSATSLVQAKPPAYPDNFELRFQWNHCGVIDPTPVWCFRIPDRFDEWKLPPLRIPIPQPDPLPVKPFDSLDGVTN